MDRSRRPVVERTHRGPTIVGPQRGAVIERASEPGLPRGLKRLFAVAVLLALVYAAGYRPDLGRLEEILGEASSGLAELWPGSKPAPAPQRQASAPTPAPSSRPPVSQPPSPPAAPAASDPFREAFNRNIIGQIPVPLEPSGQPASREVAPPGSPPLPPVPPPAVPAPDPAPPTVASAPPPPPAPAAPAGNSMFSRPPGQSPSPFSAEALDRMVQVELSTFNASRDVAVKRAAMKRIAAAARLGHGPARGLIARSFPASTVVRDAVPEADAVRYALDFVIFKRAFSTDAKRDFIALAAWFEGERRDAAFARALLDAARDDSRLRTPQNADDLMVLLARAERGCAALRRELDTFDSKTENVGHCGKDLAAALQEKAAKAGPAGADAKGFVEAVETLRNVVSE